MHNRAMFGGRAWLALALGSVTLSRAAHADDPGRCVDVSFTPSDNLQIVAWIATAAGDYVDTLFITQQTGTFGLGNRPGRFDFNSGPIWPYGRRITTFPVWSHANGQAFEQVIYQNDASDDPNACFAADVGPDLPAVRREQPQPSVQPELGARVTSAGR